MRAIHTKSSTLQTISHLPEILIVIMTELRDCVIDPLLNENSPEGIHMSIREVQVIVTRRERTIKSLRLLNLFASQLKLTSDTYVTKDKLELFQVDL